MLINNKQTDIKKMNSVNIPLYNLISISLMLMNLNNHDSQRAALKVCFNSTANEKHATPMPIARIGPYFAVWKSKTPVNPNEIMPSEIMHRNKCNKVMKNLFS